MAIDDRIYAAADMIRGANGESFLHFMSDAYHGVARLNGEESLVKASESAQRIGMVVRRERGFELTTPGFLVANVAKEYRHYVNHGRTTAPPKPSKDMFAGKDVLDLGCSFGRTLWEFQRDARSAIGLEPQMEYIILGGALSAREGVAAPKIIAGTAESLDEHFGPASLDMIFTRLVLNYVKVTPVIEKMVSALKRGGMLWILVDSPCELPRRFFCEKSMRRKGWALLAMANLPACILTGRQISVGASRRMHGQQNPAYLPLWWWRKTLRHHGLGDFQTYPCNSLAFSARK